MRGKLLIYMYLWKDEIKEFELKIEMDFESSKSDEKIKMNIPEDWINKIKQKFLHALKSLKYDSWL